MTPTRASSLFVLLSLLSAPAFAIGPLEGERPGPTASSVRESATAFAGGRFLTVWEHVGPGRHIFGALSDASGRRISPAGFPVVADTGAQSIGLIRAADQFIAVWRDHARIAHIARIDLDGRLQWHRAVPSSWLAPTAIWNGRHLLALGVRPGGTDLEIALLDLEGDLAAGPFPLGPVNRALPQHILPLRDGSFAALLGYFSDLVAVRIGSDGRLSAPVVIERAGGTTATDYYGVSATARELENGDVLIAFVGAQYGQPSVLRTAVLSRTGAVTPPVTLPAHGYRSIASLHLASTSAGTALYFRATRHDRTGSEPWELAGRRIDDAGRATDGAPVVIRDGLPPATSLAYGSSPDLTFVVTRPYNPPDAQLLSFALRAPAPVQPEVLSLTPSSQTEVRVGANAAGVVAVWNDLTGTTAEVHAAALDAAGSVSSAITSVHGLLASPRIVSSPNDHLYLRYTWSELIATRIDASGVILQDAVLAPAASAQNADAVWTGAGYLLAWTANGALFTGYLTSGAPLIRQVPLPPPPAGYSRSASNARVAFDGTTALLVWTETKMRQCGFPGCATPEPSVAALRLSPVGEAIDAIPVTIADGPASAPVVAASDLEFLLVIPHDGLIRIVRADANGIHISSRPAGLRHYAVGDAVWNGREFVIAISALGRYAGLARISRTGEVTGIRAAHAGRLGSPRIAVRGDSVTFAAVVADRFGPYRAHVLDTAAMVPLPDPPARPAITDIRILPTGQTRVAWTPVAGADGYEIEIVRGQSTMGVVFTEGETSVDVPWGLDSRFIVRAFNAGGLSADAPIPARRRTVRR